MPVLSTRGSLSIKGFGFAGGSVPDPVTSTLGSGSNIFVFPTNDGAIDVRWVLPTYTGSIPLSGIKIDVSENSVLKNTILLPVSTTYTYPLVPEPIAPVGEASFTEPGTYTWTAPFGVTSISAVCVGGGGNTVATDGSAGGGGGGLGYKNELSVTPGSTYTVVVGGPSQDSYFISTETVRGGGGGNGTQTTGGAGGTFTGDGGGNGGRGGNSGIDFNGGGGGGAGGYLGAGGPEVSIFDTRLQSDVYAVTLTGIWSPFMDAHAVWASDNASSFSRTYTVNFPYTTHYLFTYAVDNIMNVNLDGVSIISYEGFRANPPASQLILVTAGNHVINITATDTGGPEGVALTIDSTVGGGDGGAGGDAVDSGGGARPGGGGGGVGLLGAGSDGVGGSGGGDGANGASGQGGAGGGGEAGYSLAPGVGGGGGSGGESGATNTGLPRSGMAGGNYGGGASGNGNSTETPQTAGSGAVRLIWGPGRSFPSTDTGNLAEVLPEVGAILDRTYTFDISAGNAVGYSVPKSDSGTSRDYALEVAVSVIDECSVAAGTIQSSWLTFRQNWPDREFFILQPESGPYGSYTVANLKIPAEYTSDPLAYPPIAVIEDGGDTSQRLDWFALMNLSTKPAGTIISLSIDNSGSMTTALVRASYDLFKINCSLAGFVVREVPMSGENWVSGQNVSLQ